MSIKSAFTTEPPSLAQYNQVLTIYENATVHTYASGYINAVGKLVGGMESFSASDDSLIYPCVFIIRHCIELMLKDYLRTLVCHYKKCKMVKSTVHGTDYTSLNEHILVPIYSDIYKLRSIESHHKDQSIAELREDLEFLDAIDPEATAFRYERNFAGSRQVLHWKQQWVDIKQVVETARTMFCFLKAQTVSEDLLRCSSGFCSKSYLKNLKTYADSLREFVNWKKTKDAELEIERLPDRPFEWKNYRDTLERAEKTDKLYQAVREKFNLKTLKNVIIGYYIGQNEEAYRGRDFNDVRDMDSAISVLQRKSTAAYCSQLDNLNKLISRLEEMDKKIPFPP